MNRRTLLSTAGIALPTLGVLVACGMTPTGPTVTTQVTNALTVGQTVDQALIKILGDSSVLFPAAVSPGQAQTAIGWLTVAGQGLSAFLAGKQPPAEASTLTTIDLYLNDALTLAGPLRVVTIPGAAPIVAAIEAVDALLPIFEEIVTPLPAAAVARSAKRRTARSSLTQDQALGVLGGYLARR